MITLFKHLVTFATTKTRLFIEYVMISIILVVAGFCGYLWTERDRINKDIEIMSNTLHTAVEANAQQDKAITQLTEVRSQDIKALRQYVEKSNMLQEEKIHLQEQLESLEKNNETVKAYLDIAVPSDVVQLLISASEGVHNKD